MPDVTIYTVKWLERGERKSVRVRIDDPSMSKGDIAKRAGVDYTDKHTTLIAVEPGATIKTTHHVEEVA